MAVIRGGTSRGVFFAEEDLPSGGTDRDRRLLRVFGSGEGLFADGLGGENPVLRKLAIVGPRPSSDGTPQIAYRFGQVGSSIRELSHHAECGNLAAGVPLFAAMRGWCPPPEPGAQVGVELLNTGRRMRVEWSRVDGWGGAVRLTFIDPVRATPSTPWRNGEISLDGRAVRVSVVRAMNDYAFVRAADLGVQDPTNETITEELFRSLARIECEVLAELGEGSAVKVCLVGPDPVRDDAIRCRIVYPTERKLHGAFAVTGAVTVAVARCIEGSTVAACLPAPPDGELVILHPSGELPVRWTRDRCGMPAEVSLERSNRLILTGTAF